MTKKHFFATFLMAAVAMSVAAQKPMKAPAGGKLISDELIGIFFEDISSSADGGLNAQLIQNGSFEYNPTIKDGYGPGTAWKLVRLGHSSGYYDAAMDGAIHANNPHFMRVNIERVVTDMPDFDGTTGVGIQNDGHDGIVLKKDATYKFSVFLRTPDGKAKNIKVTLGGVKMPAEGTPGPRFPRPFTVSEKKFRTAAAAMGWQKYEFDLVPTEDVQMGNLQLVSETEGVLDIDMVSLLPADTYKGHGLRKDLVQALADLNPKFIRFPGGCVVHGGGDGFWNTYRWKETVGPKETRRQQKNTWGYNQSMELGYYEYFQLCEDLGAAPIPILPSGVSCQGVNGGWNFPQKQNQWVVPMEDMDEWVDEALDLIEWANGDVTTKWGKVRADAGHPAPFGLKYLGIGNEERISPEFIERFKYIYKKVTEAHPEIVIVGTAGPGSHPGNPDYDNSWKLAEELGMPIIDEHYYEAVNYFQEKRQYDNYPRDRKTKVYLGEYSSQNRGRNNQFQDALAEALYLCHVERNADVVVMTSYAPLFAKKNHHSWDPDLIYFDNERTFLTCSYYTQQMFGQSSGQYYYGDCVKIENADKSKGDGMLQEQSVILNVKTRQLFVKVCNASENAKNVKIDLSKFGVKGEAVKTTLKGKPEDENNYEAHPIAPVTEKIKATKTMDMTLEPYSFVMYTYQL
ncbi:MAG: alpha-N-arabinofuranosidase [Bacteroidales bacterium]|nr:alpha-N-arabinofuranosidase [Bacteroidales bacterium]